MDEAKAGGEQQDQQERDAIAIDGGPAGRDLKGGLIKSDGLDGVLAVSITLVVGVCVILPASLKRMSRSDLPEAASLVSRLSAEDAISLQTT